RVLLHMAVDENRVVLTHDSDFGTLAIRQGHPVVGVFYVRPGHFPAERTIETLRSVLAMNVEVTPPFIVVAQRSGDDVTVRIRELTLPPNEQGGKA
ncbi:DUF5615 family PIN-like protein, partial [Roseiconus lacunae]|uniref:DUF5615 family PIN-like protein n=1 Tax=Roseiconus lacunae TaxID=2605694 RepID=UPI001E46A1D2